MLDLTRKEIVSRFPEGYKISLRKVSFSGFGYGDAYCVHCKDHDGYEVRLSGIMSPTHREKHLAAINAMKKIREDKCSYKGEKIIAA